MRRLGGGDKYKSTRVPVSMSLYRTAPGNAFIFDPADPPMILKFVHAGTPYMDGPITREHLCYLCETADSKNPGTYHVATRDPTGSIRPLTATTRTTLFGVASPEEDGWEDEQVQLNEDLSVPRYPETARVHWNTQLSRRYAQRKTKKTSRARRAPAAAQTDTTSVDAMLETARRKRRRKLANDPK